MTRIACPREQPTVTQNERAQDRPQVAPPVRNRIDLRGEPAWMARVEAVAAALGITVTAVVKLATTRFIDEEERKQAEIRSAREQGD